MAEHNYDWVRTGHLPAFRAVVESPDFAALPHRQDIAPLATSGRPLPGYIQRQAAIEGIVGEEVAAAVNGQADRQGTRGCRAARQRTARRDAVAGPISLHFRNNSR